MKKFFLFIILAFSCTSHKYNYDVVRKTPKQKLTPPGTVWLRDNLFMDETEIDNFAYSEFLYYLSKKDTAKYSLMLPDTNCGVRVDVGFNQSNFLCQHYVSNPSYKRYPVVGISYKQATEYCNWRSKMANLFLYMRENKIKYKPDSLDLYLKRAPQKFHYRLPTKEEWEYAAAAGLNYCDYPLGYENLLDNKNRPVSNTLEYYSYFKKKFVMCYDTIPVNNPTYPVYAGKPNRYGLWQMLGNVSEIIADNQVKGLNYSKPIYSITRSEDPDIIQTQTYNYKLTEAYKRPEPWLGFRCVCEVLEK